MSLPEPEPALPDTIEECTSRGKQMMREGNTEMAIACLCKALELSVAKHGPMAPCCADAYYAYAEVLLQKAQGENDPFGDAVQKLEDEDAEDEDVDSDDEATPKPKPIGASGAGGSSQPNGDESEGEEGEGEDGAVDDLRLAWECFETARVLYAKVTDDPRARERVGECLLGLGDIRMENEDFTGAVADYEQALAILTSALDPLDRLLSHTHYQLAMAHQQCGSAAEAHSAYAAAAAVLRLRADKLAAEPGKEAEVADLREIAAEIDAKVAAEAEPSGLGGSAPAEGSAAEAGNGKAAVAPPVESGGFGKPQLATAGGGEGSASGGAPVAVLAVRRKASHAGADAEGGEAAAGKKQRISLE